MVVVIELMVALILKATRAMGTSCAPGQGVSLTHDSEQDIFSVSPRLERNAALFTIPWAVQASIRFQICYLLCRHQISDTIIILRRNLNNSWELFILRVYWLATSNMSARIFCFSSKALATYGHVDDNQSSVRLLKFNCV